MAVPLIDFKRQYDAIGKELEQAVAEVFQSGMFINGPQVKTFEQEIAALCGDGCIGIGVASGTDALLLSLRAAGIGPGDEVILPTFSFISTASVIMLLNAKPALVDIDPETYLIDLDRLEKIVTEKTKAIMPVHLYGQCADMDAINAIAKKHNLVIVEDAAQAIGAKDKNRMAGSLGDYGCLSFYPTKNLGAAGDGGMIIVKDEDKAEHLRLLRSHGWKKKYDPQMVGYNSRLDTLQAAVLSVKLKYLNEWTEKRRAHVDKYNEALADLPVKTPVERDGVYHIYNQFTIMVERRDKLIDAFKAAQIGYEVYYPYPFHILKSYKELNYSPGNFPVAEKAAVSVVSLPVYPDLTEAEQDEVIATIRGVYG